MTPDHTETLLRLSNTQQELRQIEAELPRGSWARVALVKAQAQIAFAGHDLNQAQGTAGPEPVRLMRRSTPPPESRWA
jgi:hypothetical protein